MRNVEFEGSTVCPGKVVCVGKNYVAHIEEMNSPVPEQMVVFLKPNTAIGDRLCAFAGEPLHYEGEICLLIRDDVIAGIGFGLDLTKRATQAKLKAAGLPWERSKAFDGAALFSQFVTAPASLANVVLELWVDGELRQRGGVELMMYRPATILDELHTFMTLDDNDIVMTGTPAGVGEIKPGEHFEGRLLDGDRELVSVGWIAE
ncbi:MAG: fumarylacetoacetate hydrolase family protein [Halieaceae bacterium]|jgi:2-keto-4-pentenoate hydratase/2-oxohepta-3-ene-1,7-dioic acid hydratase in catechol pathway|nr:fumarylacetoacetate hydrolase family protein [Halieaceae bacterium]